VAPAKPVHPIGAGVLHRVANEIARPAADQLVRRVDTSVTWDDLVLPEPILTRLQDVTASIAARPTVLQEWGFGSRPGSTGLNLLFAGPSGTGKTLAAAVIAGQSGHQLLACDLAQVVDKYLGETEKRLDAVLRRAEAANAVLLFDEADALFGRRADVTDARDRYANLEVAYLLQRIETHRGITILATNLGHHLDTAFSRRLHDRIEFPQPDPALRQRIWRQMLPGSAPLADDVDLAALARAVELSGGEIRAASLAAAYLAAAEGGPIRQRHLVGAVLRELDKAGRRPDRSELPGLRLAVNG
jgi:SpoVK/Ycf46/Vps4 family AAA+-type ATPase